MNDARGAIVVGIDGSRAAERAVRWAAADADSWMLPMHLVFALGGVAPVLPSAYPVQSFYEGIDCSAREQLNSATSVAWSVAPGIRITIAATNQVPVPALVDLSAHARLVVLGSSGLGGFTGMLLGSVAAGVAPRAHCPVVVVRGRDAPEGPIVLGVDDSPASAAAIGAAFDRAAQARSPLAAVHAVARSGRHTSSQEGTGEEVLARRLAECRERYAEVSCETITTPAKPEELLLDWSTRARLVVVGSRGRGGFRSLLLGSTAQALLHHAECPVLVARAET